MHYINNFYFNVCTPQHFCYIKSMRKNNISALYFSYLIIFLPHSKVQRISESLPHIRLFATSVDLLRLILQPEQFLFAAALLAKCAAFQTPLAVLSLAEKSPSELHTNQQTVSATPLTPLILIALVHQQSSDSKLFRHKTTAPKPTVRKVGPP